VFRRVFVISEHGARENAGAGPELLGRDAEPKVPGLLHDGMFRASLLYCSITVCTLQPSNRQSTSQPSP
jgi:hypothetical protein